MHLVKLEKIERTGRYFFLSTCTNQYFASQKKGVNRVRMREQRMHKNEDELGEAEREREGRAGSRTICLHVSAIFSRTLSA